MTSPSLSSSPPIIRAGFIPLIDSAPLIIAKEKGFAADQGVKLKLSREVSWANIRDRINIGQFDVAHMLAGMPIAANLGIGQIKSKMIAPMALGRGGNAITVSRSFYDRLIAMDGAPKDPLSLGHALKRVLDQRKIEGEDLLTFAMVFPFSNHNYQLRYWFAASGIDPENDLRLIVIPPPYMVRSLEAGQVDGFCVGEPWNSIATDQKVGKILLQSSQIWPAGPEKVLGMQQAWAEANSDLLAALLRAVDTAAAWADDPANKAELAQILSRKNHLEVDPNHILSALQNGMRFSRQNGVKAKKQDALWLFAQMVRWGQTEHSKEAWHLVEKTYRPDLLENATGEKSETKSTDLEPAFTTPLGGSPFDLNDIEGYIRSCTIRSGKILCNAP